MSDNILQIIGIAFAVISPLAAYAFKQDKEVDRLRLRVGTLEGQHRLDLETSQKRIADVENESISNFSEVKALLADLSKEVRDEHKKLTSSIIELTVTLRSFTREVQDQKEATNQRFTTLESDVRSKSKD
jgi:hypothetical protein